MDIAAEPDPGSKSAPAFAKAPNPDCPETIRIGLKGSRDSGLSRHSAARTHCGAELQGIRVAGLQGCIRRAFVRITINDTPPMVGIPLRAKASSVIKRCEKNFLLKSRERPSVSFLGVQARRISGECRTYRDQNRVTEKSLSHNCTAFSAL
jgi:hypothetical protein